MIYEIVCFINYDMDQIQMVDDNFWYTLTDEGELLSGDIGDRYTDHCVLKEIL